MHGVIRENFASFYDGGVYMGVHIDRQRIQEESLTSAQAVRGVRLLHYVNEDRHPILRDCPMNEKNINEIHGGHRVLLCAFGSLMSTLPRP
jgi:hypothetical protein